MNALTDAISAALIHAVWQGSIVAVLLWVVLVAMRHRTASARYAVSGVALGLIGLLPLFTTLVLYLRPYPMSEASLAISGAARAFVETHGAGTIVLLGTDLQQIVWIARLQPWVLPLWTTGVLIFSMRPLCASAHVIVLTRRSTPADGTLVAMVARVGRRLGVRRSVRVVISRLAHGPATFGWLRPIILLPPATAL
jgi:bla regulator protein BlaR1